MSGSPNSNKLRCVHLHQLRCNFPLLIEMSGATCQVVRKKLQSAPETADFRSRAAANRVMNEDLFSAGETAEARQYL
jgi:hypothetical protein